jgi:glycosyltransferase involved in cell wall biosynthesis
MKVLHLGNGNLYGGIERFLVGLAVVQAKTSVLENHYLLSHEGRLAAELRQAGVQPTLLEATRLSRPWSVLRARARLERLIDAVRPDVVVSHGPWTHGALAAGVRGAVPVVFYCHNPVTADWLHWLAGRRRADYVLANSEFTRRTVASLFPGVRSETVTYVLAGTLSGRRREDLLRDLSRPGEVVILQVSRFERWKGHLLLLQAAERLQDLPGWRIWFVGGAQRPREMEYEAELRAYSQSRGLAGRVTFLKERSDVADVLATADVFCQPNTQPEPFGLVFVEAMAAGRAIVTTEGGGPAEFLTNDFSFSVPASPESVATALRRVVVDRALRDSMGAAAERAYLSRFDPVRAAEQLGSALGRAVSDVKWA